MEGGGSRGVQKGIVVRVYFDKEYKSDFYGGWEGGRGAGGGGRKG